MPDRSMLTELKVSGHLMRLDPGLYCIFQKAEGDTTTAARALPGVRISLPPGAPESTRAIEIVGFRKDGWISSGRDAALLRVNDGPIDVLVTIYQSAGPTERNPPHLEVVRLDGTTKTAGSRTAAPSRMREARDAAPPTPGVLAHVQGVGDVRVPFGHWIGGRGSRRWIEGFALTPPTGLAEDELEYRAVLGRAWESPWTRAGQFCGSRHMALPILGLAVRLKEEATVRFECAYLASFVDGTLLGPLAPGERCVAPSLVPLEALQVILRRRSGARAAKKTRQPSTG